MICTEAFYKLIFLVDFNGSKQQGDRLLKSVPRLLFAECDENLDRFVMTGA